MKTNSWIAIFIGLMVDAVLFGAGAIAVLSFPGIGQYWKFLIPAVVLLSFVATPFLAMAIAPKLRLRNGERQGQTYR